jgi:cystathionine beta-synthase
MKLKHHPDTILDLIGNTPLIKLNNITKGIKADIFAKLEYMNPTGSIKDRMVKYMLEKAEAKGRIKPGDTIIDYSSGNTALALAVFGTLKGYKLKLVVRDNLSREKIEFLESLHADLVMVDHALTPESPDSCCNITPRIAEETPRGYYFNQHNNCENIEAHHKNTGPEIWKQTEGSIDYFVAGIGTGGTICGVSQFLKKKNPEIKVVGVDPKGSVFFDYFHTKKLITPSPYLIEGIGDEFLTGCVDLSLLDDVYQVTDKQAFLMTRRLADEEGILSGGSSGAALWTAIKLARDLDRPCRIVTVFPDSANRYLSTIYNDDWLKENKIK